MAVLAFIGVIVFGPDKLPELARQSAHLVRRAKSMADGARDELRTQLGDDYADLELRDLDPRAMVRRHISSAFDGEHPKNQDDDVAFEDRGDDLHIGSANEPPREAAHEHPWLTQPGSSQSLVRRSRRKNQHKPRAAQSRSKLTSKR